MKKGFTTFLSALKANTPPCKKRLSSRKFLSLFLILFLAVGNVWAAEVLLNQSDGSLNAKFKMTGSVVASANYTVDGTNFSKYVKFGGAYTTPAGVYETNKIAQYDATTDELTVEAWFYNKSSSKYKGYVSIIEEGSTEPTKYEYEVGAKSGLKVTRTFTPSTNATIYIHTGNNSNLFLCQAQVTETGSPLLKGGEIGYTVNLEKHRLACNKALTVLDGIEYNATSNQLKVLTSSNLVKLKAVTEYIKFDLDVLTKVSIKASGTYSVTNSATYNSEKAKSGNQDIILAAGTWYICPNGSNTSFTGLSFLTPPAMRTITLEYADGVTADGSISAVDGAPATKPTDPTWEHHRFDGWYNGETLYDWTANVTGDLTLTAHWTQLYTITYAAGDGTATGEAPTQVDKAEGETFTVAANTFEVAGKDFVKWNDGTKDYNPEDTYTVGTDNVVLTAQWKAAADKYTVIFKDGETVLDTKVVEVDSHPADIEHPTKPLYTFVSWQKEGVDIALDDAFWATVAKDAEITLTARWAKAFATSYDMEAYAVSDGASLATLLENLTAAGYAYTNVNGIDNGHTHNYIYDGMKYKTNDGDLSFNVNAGKLVIVKTGNLPANALTMYINDVADPTVFVGANEAVETHVNNYFYSAVEALYRLDIQASKGTCAIKAVTITDPFTVSFDANGGDAIEPMQGKPYITLPTTTKGTETLLGWFDAETGGNKIGEAGDTYTPTKDIKLYAQWEATSTDTRIETLTYKIGAGEEINIYEDGKNNFDIVLPYANSYEAITVAATPRHDAAIIEGTITQPTSVPGKATFTVVAQDGNTKQTYTINFAKGPKDGVSIIKVETTGGTNKTVTGLYAGEGDVNLSSSKKMDGGKYIGFTLDGTTLQAGDRINVHTTAASTSGGSHIIFYDNMTDKTELYDTEEIGGVGNNIFTINAAMVGNATAYVYRSDADAVHKWNGYIDYIEVTRAINPILKAITINGEAGTINESAKTVAVELQPGYDLAALTIVPTIVSNTAEADVVKTVESNGGNWVIGDNTYRLTDKDGDYTEYTITLSVGVLKHTVSFNTHGGSAIASVEVVDGQKLAAAPADPTREDYLFQGWAETEDGSIVDVTSFAISADKEFHAVWAPDGAIKLLNGATVNHTNFITGVTADETVAFMGNNVNYAKFSGTVSGVNGVKDLTRVIAYNATTNKTKIRIYAHNNSTSGRNILVKGLVEGATAAVDLATIALGNKEDKISDWIEFNNAANRTIYIMVSSSASDVYFTQVKVIESGETPMKQAGEAGYSLNFKKGRFFGLANKDLAFEGLNTRLSGDYTALNSDYAKLNATSMSFTVASAMTLSVTANNSKTYYVTKDAAGTDNETAKSGVSEFDLTAGTWYITAGSSEVQFTNIAFTAPKCGAPVFNALANSDICSGDPYVALDGTGTVTDEGTITYKWYAEGADESDPAAVLGTDAEYTPGADGAYYVVATNSLAGYTDNVVQSEVVTVTTHTGAAISEGLVNQRGVVDDVVTLTVTASGKDLHYTWKECATIGGTYTDVAGAADAASLDVTITEGLSKYYKVIVHSDCGEDQESIAKVEQFVPVVQQNVTGSTVWDWTKAASVNEIKLTDATTPKKNEGFVMANGAATVYNNANFESDKLYLEGEYIIRTEGGKLFQGQTIKFNTTIDGAVRVTFSHTGSGKPARELFINGVGTGTSVTGTSQTETGLIEVPAGEVAITAFHVNPTDGAGQQYVRVYKIEFLALGYTRDVNVGELATVCLPNACVARDVEVYELVGKEPQYGKIVFDEILSGELMAGKPYLLRVTNPKAKFYYTVDAPAAEPDNSGAMKGTFVDMTLTNLTNIYYFAQKALWSCVDLTSLSVPANRAYVKMDEMPEYTESNPAPGVRRITLGVNGQQVATGVDQVQGDEVPTKMIINGQLFILRGEKMYDAQGKLVK